MWTDSPDGQKPFPSPDPTAATVAQAFVSGWIARFGVPSTITTDKGAQLESALFQHLLSLLGSCHTRTTSYYPQSNGLVERFHRHLKACLRASVQPASWVSNLPIALLGIRAAFREDLGCSSAELVYSTTIRLPSEFFSAPPATVAPSPHHYVQSCRQSLSSFRPEDAVPRTCPRPSYISHDMDTCGMVYLCTDAVRKPLQPPYSGPYKVLHRSAKYFRLDINGKATEVSIDRLKPAYSLSSHSATAVSALFWPDPTTALLSPAAMPFVPRAREVTFGLSPRV